MIDKQFSVSLVFWCIVGCCQATCAIGADIVFDNFDDGNFTDGDPGNWARQFSVHADASSGDLVVKETNCCSGIVFGDLITGDVSIQTQARVMNGTIGFGTKYNVDGSTVNSGYWLSVSPDGLMSASVTVDNVDYDVASVPITVQHDEDIIFQMDTVGNKISAWYWTASSNPPASPQLTLELEGHPFVVTGYAGIWLGDDSESVVRYIRIADAPIPIPEPSGAVLALIGVAILSVSRRPGARRVDVLLTGRADQDA